MVVNEEEQKVGGGVVRYAACSYLSACARRERGGEQGRKSSLGIV